MTSFCVVVDVADVIGFVVDVGNVVNPTGFSLLDIVIVAVDTVIFGAIGKVFVIVCFIVGGNGAIGNVFGDFLFVGADVVDDIVGGNVVIGVDETDSRVSGGKSCFDPLARVFFSSSNSCEGPTNDTEYSW